MDQLCTDSGGETALAGDSDAAGGLLRKEGAATGRRVNVFPSRQRWDAALGLYDYRARYYDPALGRFISADTIVPNPGNPQDLNRYAYVRNNPLRYTDPSGHCVAGLDTAICIAAGLAILKAVDYGWTAYDVYQSGRVLAN
ncbi:MAG: RHS repeat-associated core domain-containing protein, partial [Thermoflexales bacterium]|nr:RHS repeat-associated core domain-containing protein [Thermoflexales bacterium]